MTSTAVLAQADSVANWVGVAGQWAGALATVFVAFKVDQWQRHLGGSDPTVMLAQATGWAYDV